MLDRFRFGPARDGDSPLVDRKLDVLETRDLSVFYGNVHALNGFSFRAPRGQVTVHLALRVASFAYVMAKGELVVSMSNTSGSNVEEVVAAYIG